MTNPSRIIKRLPVVVLFAMLLLISGCNFNIKKTRPPVTLDSLAAFNYQAIVQMAEKEENLKDSLVIEDNGLPTRYTIILPGSDMPLTICWDDTSRLAIRYVATKGNIHQNHYWITRDSVTIGINLAKLELINKAPVIINDRGFVTSFGNGLLGSGIYSLRIGTLKDGQRGVTEMEITPGNRKIPLRLVSYNPDNDISEWDDSLKKYFTPEQIPVVKRAVYEYNTIQSAADLAHYYLVTLDSIIKIVNIQIEVSDQQEYSGDNGPEVHWNWFDDYFPGIGCDVLCSECSFEAMTLITPLVKKAAETPEQEDDLFFKIGDSIYSPYDGAGGSIGNTGGWYTLVDCDFCAASLLGSGQYASVLQLLHKAAASRALFGSVMDRFKQSALGVEDDRYYHSKDKVLAEIDQMLKSPLLNVEEKKKLQESRSTIESGIGIQFGCESGNCTWEY